MGLWVLLACYAMPPRSDIYRWRDGDDNGEGWGRGHERSTRHSPEASEGILIMGGGGLLCSSHVNFISLLHNIPFWRYTYLPSSLIHPKNVSASHSPFTSIKRPLSPTLLTVGLWHTPPWHLDHNPSETDFERFILCFLEKYYAPIW